jgi:hypothetical protein
MVVVVLGMVVVVLVVTGWTGTESLACLLVATAPELHPATNAAMRNTRSVHPEKHRQRPLEITARHPMRPKRVVSLATLPHEFTASAT